MKVEEGNGGFLHVFYSHAKPTHLCADGKSGCVNVSNDFPNDRGRCEI